MNTPYTLQYEDYYELYKIVYKKRHDYILSPPINPDEYHYDVLCSYADTIKFLRLFHQYPSFDWTVKFSGIDPNNHNGWLHNENEKIVLFDALEKDSIKLDSDAFPYLLYGLNIVGTTLLKNYFEEKNVDFNFVFLKQVAKFPHLLHRQYVHFLMQKDISIFDNKHSFDSVFNYFTNNDYCAEKLGFLEVISKNLASLDIDKCAIFLAKFMNRHESISPNSIKCYLAIQQAFCQYDLTHLHHQYPVLKKLNNYNNVSSITHRHCFSYGIDTNLIAYQSVLQHDDIKKLYEEINNFIANIIVDDCSDYIYSHEYMKKAKFVFIFNDEKLHLRELLTIFFQQVEHNLQEKIVLEKKQLQSLWDKISLYHELDNNLDKQDNKKHSKKNKI